VLTGLQRVPQSHNRVLISINPRAGTGDYQDLFGEFVRTLTDRGWRASVHTKLDELLQEAKAAQAEQKLRAVIGAGGDGTLAELANRLSPEVPLMPLPLGTENLIARHLKITNDPNTAAKVIDQGLSVRWDAGQANGRCFLIMTSCGMDAEIVEQTHAKRSGKFTRWNYAGPIWRSLRSYTYPELRVRYLPVGASPEVAAEPNRWPMTSARWCFLFNLPCYGGGLNFAPDAKPHDGALDLCLFTGSGFGRTLYYVLNVGLGWHRKLADCQMERVQKVRVEADSPVPFQVDGDPGGQLPLDLEIVPRRVTMMVSKAWAKKQGFDLDD